LYTLTCAEGDVCWEIVSAAATDWLEQPVCFNSVRLPEYLFLDLALRAGCSFRDREPEAECGRMAGRARYSPARAQSHST